MWVLGIQMSNSGILKRLGIEAGCFFVKDVDP
jgi:hypothetical protein